MYESKEFENYREVSGGIWKCGLRIEKIQMEMKESRSLVLDYWQSRLEELEEEFLEIKEEVEENRRYVDAWHTRYEQRLHNLSAELARVEFAVREGY